MLARRLPQLLTLVALAVATTGLATCGGDAVSDVEPKSAPALRPPSGDSSPGAGDQVSSLSDLPQSTTGPTPATSTDSSGSSDTSSGDGSSGGTSGGTSSGGTGTGTGTSGGTSGGASTGSGTGTGSSGSGSSGSGSSGSGSSGSGSSGGAAPGEFNEFCQTNPGVCR